MTKQAEQHEADILPLGEAIGYLEMEDALYDLWRRIEKEGGRQEGADILRHAHDIASQFIFRKHSNLSVARQKWHVATVFSRLLKIHGQYGHDSRFSHPDKDRACARSSLNVPSRYSRFEPDFESFPFKEGGAIQYADNPNLGRVVVKDPYPNGCASALE